MFFTKVLSCLSIVVLSFAIANAAPEGRITLDHVEGNTVDNQIGIDDLTFYFRYEVFSESDNVKGFSNGFKIYSPEGATWTTPVADTINGIADNFDLIFTLNYFSVNGSGADTISMGGSVLWEAGLAAGYNMNVLTITTAIDPNDHGKTLCIDSAWYPPTGVWLWTGGTAGSLPPEWVGPYCFEINGCLGNDTLPDSDNDGNPDLCDECPYDPDNDIDNGGICGDVDNCPTVGNSLQEDADIDGIGDACDECTDTDNDGFGNPGYANNICADDNCPDLSNPDQGDADSDGIGDACDVCTDTDGDGFGNPGFSANTCPVDNCPDDYNPDQTDGDGDGKGDDCDNCFDTDGDGYGDPGHPENECSDDNCPDIANSNQADADGDGLGDVCDDCTDTDGDGFGNPEYPDNTCPDDNCPDTYNPSQEDSDGDGVGDVCDFGEFIIVADMRCGEAPLTVNFSVESITGDPLGDYHALWWFGDGETSNAQTPAHTYDETGVFDVKALITTSDFSDILNKEDFISTQTEIGADIFAIPERGEAPLTVVFDANFDGIANGFYWDFGDGDTSNIHNPIHTYEQNGIYDVTFVARLLLGECDQVDSIVKQGLIKVSDLKPEFSSNFTAGEKPLSVSFINESMGSLGNRLWRFGELGSSIVDNPIFTFNDTGYYNVFLKIWDLSSDVD